MAIVQIQLRRDNTTNWTSVNPTLASGEPAYDTTLKTLKIGDGTTNYLTLPALDFHTHIQVLETTDSPTFASLSSSFHDFDELGNGFGTPPDHKAGRIWYDHEEGALVVYNGIFGISMQVGQEQWTRVYNGSGADITDGTPVFMSGSQGDNPLVYPAVALAHDHDYRPIHVAGMATHTIGNNEVGFITTAGKVHGLDTSGYTVGQPLFLTTVVGELSNIAPPFPYGRTRVGGVVRSHASDGVVFVTIREPVHFEDIAGLSASLEQHNDIWVYEESNEAWTNRNYNMNLSGSFSGSFQGDGSNLTGVGSDPDSVETLTNKTLDSVLNTIGADHLHIKVKAGEDLVQGQLVTKTGYNLGEDAIIVATPTSKDDLIAGILHYSILNGEFGGAQVQGIYENIDMATYNVDDILYSDGLGGFTTTIPTGSNYQQLAFVLRDTDNNGAIYFSAGAPIKNVYTKSETDSTFLPLTAGETVPLTGDLHMGNHNIQNIETIRGGASNGLKLNFSNTGITQWDEQFPATTNTYGLGTDSLRYKNIYAVTGSFNDIYTSGSIVMGDETAAGNVLQIIGSSTDNTYDGVKISKKYPRFTLDDTFGVGVSFNFWNLGKQMRFGTDTGASEYAAWYTKDGIAADVIFNGNVGIGEPFPTHKLEVIGDTYISGSVTGSQFIKDGGTSDEFLKADGSSHTGSYIESTLVGETIVGTTINNTIRCTQAQYDAGTPVATTQYLIIG